MGSVWNVSVPKQRAVRHRRNCGETVTRFLRTVDGKVSQHEIPMRLLWNTCQQNKASVLEEQSFNHFDQVLKPTLRGYLLQREFSYVLIKPIQCTSPKWRVRIGGSTTDSISEMDIHGVAGCNMPGS